MLCWKYAKGQNLRIAMNSVETPPPGRQIRRTRPILTLGLILLVGGAPLISCHPALAKSRTRSRAARHDIDSELPANKPASIRVRRIGMQLSRLSTRRDITFSYHVMRSEELINAYASSDGSIVITTGLLKIIRNDAELALILGHETAHLDRHHEMRYDQAMQRIQSARETIRKNLLGKNAPPRRQTLFDATANIATAVYSLVYTRQAESEADAYGIRWMSELGYNPRAAVAILDRQPSGNGLQRLLSSHPSSRERKANLLAEIDREHLMDVARHHGGPRLNDSFGVRRPKPLSAYK